MDEKMEKLKRVPNFSTYEEELLISLVVKRQEVLECKKTDVNSSRLKELEWQDLSTEFNANSAHPRDPQALRRKYENIKKRTKKKYADEKVYVKGTGGGPMKPLKFTYVDESLKSILGTRVTGKTSEFDDDRDSDLDDKENRIPITSSPLITEEETEHNMGINVDGPDEDSTNYKRNKYALTECSNTNNSVEEIEDFQSPVFKTIFQQPEPASPTPIAAPLKNSTESKLPGCSADIIYNVEDPRKRQQQCKVFRDWSKYDPSMLKQPRSFSLMPSTIKKKMCNSVTSKTLVQIPQSAKSNQRTPTISKSTPKNNCNTVWTHVGNAKLELIKIQKQIIIEESEQKRKREDEIHALTLLHKEEEHAFKMKILETELMLKTKKC